MRSDADQLRRHYSQPSVRRLVLFSTAIVTACVAFLAFVDDWSLFSVHGGSMEPYLSAGDLIVTAPIDASSVGPGQVIVFEADWASERYEHRVVHRVASTETVDGEAVAFTRGDANSVADPVPVVLSQDVRVVRFRVSGGAFWIEVLTHPVSLTSGIIALALAVAALAVARNVPVVRPESDQPVEPQPIPGNAGSAARSFQP